MFKNFLTKWRKKMFENKSGIDASSMPDFRENLPEINVRDGEANMRAYHPLYDNKIDAVVSPSHYTTGGIEVLDYLKAKLSPEKLEGFLSGNILKYLSRYEYKNGVEDLKKAEVYLKHLIELIGPKV